MAHRQKRLCKAQEAFNSKSRISISDEIGNLAATHKFDPDCRILAIKTHGSSKFAAAELERPADDAFHVQRSLRNTKECAPRRLKTAEELHFEAIQDYHLRYEKEIAHGNLNDEAYGVVCTVASSPEALQSHIRMRAPVGSVDGVNIPVDESKYVNACEDVPPFHGDEGALYSIANGFEAELPNISNMEKQVSINDPVENIIPSEALQFPLQADGKNAERMKSIQARTPNLDPSKSSTRRPPSSQITSPLNSSIIVTEGKYGKTRDLNSSQNHCRSGNEKVLQNESPPSKDEGSQTEEENMKFEGNGDLTEDQKIRIERNKAAALARRNMRICEEAVMEAQAKGVSFPKFESLLVDKSWVGVLGVEFKKPYMERLHQFVIQEAAGRIPIYPPPAKLFNALNSCPFDKVKVVIIGQDPYHGPGQAMGLCFSVEKGIKLPSSLSNIFLEMESDLYCDFPSHGNLEKWAHQGVLLLNTVLTVRDHHANSHAKKGWELFTDAVIRALAQQRSEIVFFLWGNQAQEKLRLINKTSHHILKAFHPSGISAHKGFFKCRHFSKCNQILVDQGSLPVDWQL